MAKQTNAVWNEIDPATLNGDAATLYQQYKEAYRIAKAMRVRFEEEMNELAGLPEGKKLAFGYNFGKLSVAIVDDERKATSKTKSPQSLGQFLAAQQASGARV